MLKTFKAPLCFSAGQSNIDCDTGSLKGKIEEKNAAGFYNE